MSRLASTRVYASTVHCSPASEEPSERWMAGSAMFTIVASSPTISRPVEQITSTRWRERVEVMSVTVVAYHAMTATVVTTIISMARWQPDARGRLRQAALELYGEHGFDQTTVAQIAERAGLTERTFYRHFADKREVVFSGEVQRVLVSTLADAPASMTAIEAVTAALDAAGAVLDERRDMTRRRQAVIAANPSLQQGEQIKYAMLAADMAEALRGRGVEPLSARLAADAGVAVFRAAFERWIDEDEHRDFGRLVRDTLDELAAVIGG